MRSAEVERGGIHWAYRSDAFLAGLEQALENGLEGELVKATPKRRVVRLPRVYAKEVRYRGLSALCKSLAGGTACREGRIALQLAARGIAVPEVLAFGAERRGGVVRRDLLLTREVTGGVPLLDVWRRGSADLTPRESFRLVGAFGAFMRELHDRGVLHTDLHIGNLLVVCHGEVFNFVLLDTDRVRLRPHALGRRERVANLGQLLSNLWTMTSRSQRRRFLQGYGEDGRVWTEDVVRCALRASRRVWNGKARRSLHTNSRFLQERRSGFRIFRQRTEEGDVLAAALLPDPDKVLEAGTIVKSGRTTRVARVEIEGKSYFLKRYNSKGWGYRLRNAFRRSRAVQTWLVSWGFVVRGLPVPPPLLCLEERHFRLLGRSYLLTGFVADATPASRLWRSLEERARSALLVRLAMTLGTMHRFGCLHGDLKWNNLLVVRSGSVVLTDLDGSRILVRPTLERARKDIGRFLRDLNSRQSETVVAERFLACWRRWSLG